MAELKAINPWRWQDAFDYSQAVQVHQAHRQLLCSGQTAVDEQGHPQHPGDMAAQLELAFDNLETVLASAGLSLLNVARLNFYVTDLPAFLAAGAVVSRRLQALQVKPAGTLLGVSALFHPAIMVEIEATAVE
ncbi:MAG: RidA family protein [Nevskiaceae bacterium]|nr:RidA family protein [Nevskiaceae bacterium]